MTSYTTQSQLDTADGITRYPFTVDHLQQNIHVKRGDDEVSGILISFEQGISTGTTFKINSSVIEEFEVTYEAGDEITFIV